MKIKYIKLKDHFYNLELSRAEVTIKDMVFSGEGGTKEEAYKNLIRNINNYAVKYFKEGLVEARSAIKEARKSLKRI